MSKSREYVERMLDIHKKDFEQFKLVHDQYALDQTKYQEAFNKEGERIQEILIEWENKLCKQSEKGGFSQFTPKLAESFRSEVRKYFPMIDYLGVKVSYDPSTTNKDVFVLKKISL